MTDFLELEIGFDEFESTQLWNPGLDPFVWEGVDSWLGVEACGVLE